MHSPNKISSLHSVPFFHSILFHSILIQFTPFCSFPFCSVPLFLIIYTEVCVCSIPFRSVLFFQIMIRFFPLVSLPHSVSFRSVIPDLIYRGLCVCSIPFRFISLHSAPFRSVLLNNDAIFSLCLPPSLRSFPLFLI